MKRAQQKVKLVALDSSLPPLATNNTNNCRH